MIIKQNGDVIESSEEFKQIEARINQKDLGVIATLLSSNQYSDPERSFIREIVSNAWDAHVAAKNTDQPVLVIIHNHSITIRDYGTGLSQDDFENIYCAIGSSNKRDSNDFIGGFGLGHLSSLACSDTVFIDDYYNGKCYHYIMTKEVNNITTILTEIEDTEEHNGLAVKIDISNPIKYINALSNIWFFPNVYVDYHLSDSYYLKDWSYNSIQFKKFQYYSVANKSTQDRILLGNVSYPINNYLFNNEVRSILNDISKTGIVFNFNIGELDVTPNREGLIYTEEAIDLITDRIKKAWQEIQVDIKRVTSRDYDSLLEYSRALNIYYYDPFNLDLGKEGVRLDWLNIHMTFKGKKLNQREVNMIASTNIPCLRFILMDGMFYGPKSRVWRAQNKNRLKSELPIILVDQPITDWVKTLIKKQYKEVIICSKWDSNKNLQELRERYKGSWDEETEYIATTMLAEFFDNMTPAKFTKPKDYSPKRRVIKTIIHDWNANAEVWKSVEIADLENYFKECKKGIVVLQKDQWTDNELLYYRWKGYNVLWVRKDIYKQIMDLSLTNILTRDRALKRAARYNSLSDRDFCGYYTTVLRLIPNFPQKTTFHFYGGPVSDARDTEIEKWKPVIKKYIKAFEELRGEWITDTTSSLFWFIFSRMYKLRVSTNLYNDKFVKVCLK